MKMNFSFVLPVHVERRVPVVITRMDVGGFPHDNEHEKPYLKGEIFLIKKKVFIRFKIIKEFHWI